MSVHWFRVLGSPICLPVGNDAVDQLTKCICRQIDLATDKARPLGTLNLRL